MDSDINSNTPIDGMSSWWMFLMRGLFAVAFGITIFFKPFASAAIFLTLFGVFVLAVGLFAFTISFLQIDRTDRWWIIMLDGLVCIGVGLSTFYFPTLTIIWVVWLIAAWAITSGVLQLTTAFATIGEGMTRIIYAIAGGVGIALGIYLFSAPFRGITALMLAIGIYTLVFGATQIALAFRVKILSGVV